MLYSLLSVWQSCDVVCKDVSVASRDCCCAAMLCCARRLCFLFVVRETTHRCHARRLPGVPAKTQQHNNTNKRTECYRKICCADTRRRQAVRPPKPSRYPHRQVRPARRHDRLLLEGDRPSVPRVGVVDCCAFWLTR